MTEVWICDDCPFKTRDEDQALKHSTTIHPINHKLTLENVRK